MQEASLASIRETRDGPYTVVWHQKGEKTYIKERYPTPEEASERLTFLWRHGHREAVGALTPRTDFAIALVWRFIERDRFGRQERLEGRRVVE